MMKVEGRKETYEFHRAISDPVPMVCSSPGFPKPLDSSGLMPSTLQIYWRFLLAGLTRKSQTGAVVPSQKFLIDQMIAPVPIDYRRQVVELGAGTGVLTMRLAAKRPSASILACEINPVLARDVQARVVAARLQARIQVVQDAAEQVLFRLRQDAFASRPDFVISGIPIGNLGKEPTTELIERIYQALRPGGMYIQFQYSLLDRKKIKTRFSRLRTVPVLLNFPPAVVYYAWK
jgi:phospholipid N-methyltransferase